MSFDFKKYKNLPKISSIVVLAAFFMPFFLIKCGGQTIASVSGVSLCVGTEVGSDIANNSSKSEIITPKAFAIFGVLTAVGLVVISFLKLAKQNLIQLIIASIGLLCILILKLNMSFALDDLDSSKKMITIDSGLGFYLAFLGFLATIIFCAGSMKAESAMEKPPARDDVVDIE